MQVKTITTAAGVNEIDFGNDSSQSTAHFYWLKNLGDSTLYVSANPNPIAEKDDVAELPAKGAVSVETDEGKIYILGAGKVEIHRTNSKFCPFDWQSSGSGGGGIIDAYSKTESDAKYAQKTDIPTSLPANGGNADTLGGKSPSDFVEALTVQQTSYTRILIPDNVDVRSWLMENAKIGTIYYVTPECQGQINLPPMTEYGWAWFLFDGIIYVSKVMAGGDSARYYLLDHVNTPGDWKEISTTPIKSTGQITSPTDQYGAIILPNSSTRRYLSITAVGCYAEMLLINNEYTVHIKNGNYEAIINTPVTYIAFYIE